MELPLMWKRFGRRIKRLLYKIIESDNAEIKSNDVYGMMLTFKR